MHNYVMFILNEEAGLQYLRYSQVPNKRPFPLSNFSIFSNPLDLIRTLRLLILRKIKFFTNSLLYLIFLLVLSGQISRQNSVILYAFYFSVL